MSRRTRTDSTNPGEIEIHDVWYDLHKGGNTAQRSLSTPWVGRTEFDLLKPPAKPGYKWCSGRETKINETTRPDHIWPEIWDRLSKKQRADAILEGVQIREREEPARKHRKLEEVPEADRERYKKIMSDVRKRLQPTAVPAMPVHKAKCLSATSTNAGGDTSLVRSNGKDANSIIKKLAEDYESESIDSIEGYCMVHTPVSIKKALEMPKAKEALEKEWNKLEKLPAWLKDKVMAKAQVIANARKNGSKVHFGTLMDLCFEKHSQLAEALRVYKGRVVFRGDQVKDEEGFFAIFSDEGSSASHMATAKFLDAVARMPNCAGEDADATSAYTQVILADMPDHIDTWISLPPHRRPASWKKIENPVCPLVRNLYGHPLAGLYWEKHCQKAIFKAGFEKVMGHECLYVNKEKQLFLSVYVDDFKMAGKASNITPMWKVLGKDLELDPPVPSTSAVYLGCTQAPWIPDAALAQAKHMFDKSLYNTKVAAGDTFRPPPGL